MRNFKAISLKQPWANLVAGGEKTIETRKWKTEYRGDLVICSSKVPKIEPAGFALCIVELYSIEPMKKKHEKGACIKVYDGAYAWHLRSLRRFAPIFPVKGQLGIYDINVADDVKIAPVV